MLKDVTTTTKNTTLMFLKAAVDKKKTFVLPIEVDLHLLVFFVDISAVMWKFQKMNTTPPFNLIFYFDSSFAAIYLLIRMKEQPYGHKFGL